MISASTKDFQICISDARMGNNLLLFHLLAVQGPHWERYCKVEECRISLRLILHPLYYFQFLPLILHLLSITVRERPERRQKVVWIIDRGFLP